MAITILTGCCLSLLATLPDKSVNTCVTSPPYYGLRDYGVAGQLGLEPTPEEYVANMVKVFREVRRTLKDDGTLWLNIGDSYANVGKWGGSSGGKHAKALHGNSGVGRGKKDYGEGLKNKDLIGIPWMLAFALRADGWYLRTDIIWHKPNSMPESVTDRPTRSHEYLFLLSKSERYHYDHVAVKEEAVGGNSGKAASFKRSNSKRAAVIPGQSVGTHRPDRPDVEYNDARRNRRSVWSIATKSFPEAHFATYPPELAEPCILAGCPAGGTVLDPFFGAGTTGLVADRLGRNCIGMELNSDYAAIARKRLGDELGMFAGTMLAAARN